MIINNGFYLRAIEEEDLEWMKKLRNDESTWSNLGHFVFINDFRQKKWFENISSRQDVEYLIFGKDNKNLGIVRLTEIDRINKSVCVGGDIVPSQRGNGFAKEMYQLIFKLCFDTWNMNRVWLLVLKTNKIALNLYKKMGFVEEGRQRDAIYKNSKFIDYIMMSILKKEFKNKI